MPRTIVTNCVVDTFTAGFHIRYRPSVYSFSDPYVFYRIHGVLVGIIAQENLDDSYQTCLFAPTILVMIRCYLSFNGDQDAEVLELGRAMEQTSKQLFLSLPPQTTEIGMMFHFMPYTQ